MPEDLDIFGDTRDSCSLSPHADAAAAGRVALMTPLRRHFTPAISRHVDVLALISRIDAAHRYFFRH